MVQPAAGHVTKLISPLCVTISVSSCNTDLASSDESKIDRKQYASNRSTGKPAGHLHNKHPRKSRDSSHSGTIPVVGPSPLTAAFARIASAQENMFNKDSADRFAKWDYL